MKRGGCLTNQERSKKGTILSLQVVLAICCERDIIQQGLVAQIGIQVLYLNDCIEGQFSPPTNEHMNVIANKSCTY